MQKSKSLTEITEKPHYSLRKLNIGVVSALIGASIFICETKLQTVQAATISDPAETQLEQHQTNNQTQDDIPDDPTNSAIAPQIASYANKSVKTKLSTTQNAGNANTTNNSNANEQTNTVTTNNEQTSDIVPTDPESVATKNAVLTTPTTANQNITDDANTQQIDSDIADTVASKKLTSKSLTRKTGKEDITNNHSRMKATYDYDTDTLDFYGTTAGDNQIYGSGHLLGVDLSFINSVKHIVFHEKLQFYFSARWLFADCTNLVDITGLDKLDMSEVNNMSDMFDNCQSLKELDLSTFNTSKVTDMSAMFNDCYNLTKLNLSNFDTSQVTDMNLMFAECSNLTTLDLSNFKTGQVTDMAFMFLDCNKLQKLDLSNFDTGNVTNMSNMFNNCNSLTHLDISNFNTSKVNSMQGMFVSCSNLADLNVASFDTGNVTNMNGMFKNCTNLTSLDLSNFDTSKVTDMENMLANCTKLKNLDISNFTINNKIITTNMFEQDDHLQILHLGNKTHLSDNMALVDNTWYNVGKGSLDQPAGDKQWPTADLIKNYNPDTDADTYVATSYVGKVRFHYLDADNNNAAIVGMPEYSTIAIGSIDNNTELTNNLAELKKKGYILIDDPLSKLVTGADFKADENFLFKHTRQENTKINFNQNYVIHYQDENGQKVADDDTKQRSPQTPVTVTGTYDFVTHQFVDDNDHPLTVTTFDDTTLTKKNPVVKGYVTKNSNATFATDDGAYGNTALKNKPVSFWNKLLSQIPNHDSFSSDSATNTVQDVFDLPDWEQIVTYQKVGHFIPSHNGNVIPNITAIAYENDPNDATKVLAAKDLPTIAGYETPKAGIMPADPTKDTLVNYLVTNKTVIDFLDQDNNQQPIAGIDSITNSYSIKQKVGQDSDTKAKINAILQQLAKQHYLLVTDPLAQDVLATEGEQKLHYIFKHDLQEDTDTVTHTRTIYAKDSQENNLADPIVQSANFKRSKTTDLVTNKVTYGDWDQASQTYAAISAAQLARKGYTHTPQAIASEAVTPDSQDKIITVTYNAISHTYTIIYYDQVTGKELARDQVVLNEGQKTTYSPSDKVKQLLNSGYEDTQNQIPHELNMPYDSSDQTKEIKLAHKTNVIQPGGINPITGEPIPDMTRTITRTIKYIGTKKAISDTVQSVTFNRTATIDSVTGAVTYNAWDNNLLAYGAVTAPKVPGYTADKTEIPNINVTPDSKNIIETVTYSPIKHTITIVYRDLDDNDKIITQDQVSGNEGDTIAYDKAAKLAELAKQHYVHDAQGDTLPQELKIAYDSTDTIYYVGLRHSTTKVKPGDKNPVTGDMINGLSKTIKRTIKYQDDQGKPLTQGIDGSDVHEIVQNLTFNRTGSVDNVTGKVTYDAWQEAQQTFAAINAPTIYGYQVQSDQKQIPSQVVTGDSQDIITIITYTKQGVKAEYHVIFKDLTDNKILYTATLTGNEGETITYDPSSKIQDLISQGYIHDAASDTLPNEIKVPYHATGEDYIMGFKHKIVTYKPGDKNPLTGQVDDRNLVKTVTKTVKYKGAPNDLPDDVQSVKFSRTANVDLAKKTITYNDWDQKDYTFKDVIAPTVAGYLPDKAKSVGQTVTPDSQDITETITYSKKQENKTITHFIDQDNNQQEISGIAPITNVNQVGKVIIKPDAVTEIVKQLLAKGYEIVTDPFTSNTVALNGSQNADYVFKHKVTKTAKTITRKETVQFVDQNGNKLAPDDVQNITFVTETTTDLVTGKTTNTGDRQTKKTQVVTAPVIKGYLADQKAIVSQDITNEQDLAYKVVYQKLGQIVPVDEQGKVIANQVFYENDPTDATKIKVSQNVPTITGYEAKLKTITPTDPTKDTLVTYTKKISTISSDSLPDDPSSTDEPDLSDITNAKKPRPLKPQLVNTSKQQNTNKHYLINNKQNNNSNLNDLTNINSFKQVNNTANFANKANSKQLNKKQPAASAKQAGLLPQTSSKVGSDAEVMLLGLGLALLALGSTTKPKKKQ